MTELIESKEKRRFGWVVILRFVVAIIVWFFCYQLIVGSARTGLSRLFTMVAIVQPTVEPADLAVKISPADPEAHYTRGLTLINLQRLPEAVVELRQAIQLRPHHYYQWLDLGVTLDRLGDQAGAAAALQKSVELAPSFAQPRWQRGNLLFRQGTYEEAFQDLRLAVKSNPSLSEGMLELAWVAADNDVNRFEALVKPETSLKRFELAAFLARQEQSAEVVNQIRIAGQPQGEADLNFLRQAITKLLADQKFADAYAAWSLTHPTLVGEGSKGSGILNGDFANPIPQNDPGFGWQLAVVPNIAMSIDTGGPQPGARSIQLEYKGESASGSQPIRQLVLLEKDTRYSLSFMAKTDNLVTGGPPEVVIFDGAETRLLGQSGPISAGTTGWTPHNIDFYVDENTSAVHIGLQRVACSQNPCPAFGRLWLSNFVVTKKRS